MKNLSLMGNGMMDDFNQDKARDMMTNLEIFNFAKLVGKKAFVEKRGYLNQEDKVKKNLHKRQEKRAQIG